VAETARNSAGKTVEKKGIEDPESIPLRLLGKRVPGGVRVAPKNQCALYED